MGVTFYLLQLFPLINNSSGEASALSLSLPQQYEGSLGNATGDGAKCIYNWGV